MLPSRQSASTLPPPTVRTTFFRLLRDDGGATLVEYALIVALIAGVCIAVITTVGGKVKSLFTSLGSKLPGTVS